MDRARLVLLCTRETAGHAVHAPGLVRRVRALRMMGVKLAVIAAVCELPTDTIQDYTLMRRRRDAGRVTDSDILSAAEVIARWAIERQGA